MAFNGKIFDFEDGASGGKALDAIKKAPKKRGPKTAKHAANINNTFLGIVNQKTESDALEVSNEHASIENKHTDQNEKHSLAQELIDIIDNDLPEEETENVEKEPTTSSLQKDPVNMVFDKYRKAWRLRKQEETLQQRGVITWPSETKSCCWWCCHSFDSIPVPLPTHYDQKLHLFSVRGIFCSWGCAKAYSLVEGSVIYRQSELLTMLRRRIEGKTISIKAAPYRNQLKMFGGDMSIDEFRAASATECAQNMLSVNFAINHHGLKFIPQIKENYETHANYGIMDPSKERRNKDLCFSNITVKKNEPLKLKRGKPTAGNKGKTVLEKVLGIQVMT